MSSLKERFVIGRDFNTKDWFVYDNDTNRYIVYADTEAECWRYIIYRAKENNR